MKSAALLQRCTMASRSTAKKLQSGWLLKHCLEQPFGSDKQRFGSATKTPRNDNQRCIITAHPLQKCKECLCGISFNSLSEAIGSSLIAEMTAHGMTIGAAQSLQEGFQNTKNVHVIYRNN